MKIYKNTNSFIRKKPLFFSNTLDKYLKPCSLKDNTLIQKVEQKLKHPLNITVKEIILKSSGININKESFYPINWNKTNIIKEIDYIFKLIKEYAKEDWANDIYGFDMILEEKDPLLPIGTNDLGDTYILDLKQMQVYLLYHDEPYLERIGNLKNLIKSKK